MMEIDCWNEIEFEDGVFDSCRGRPMTLVNTDANGVQLWQCPRCASTTTRKGE